MGGSRRSKNPSKINGNKGRLVKWIKGKRKVKKSKTQQKCKSSMSYNRTRSSIKEGSTSK